MSEPGPQLYTIGEILDQEDDLQMPLLVQQRNGNNLLLHHSLRIPYLICQALELPHNNLDTEFFLIPLNNKGYYGSVSSNDETSAPHSSLGNALSENVQRSDNQRSDRGQRSDNDFLNILTTSLLPVQNPERQSRNSETVLLPGSVLKVPLPQRCNLLQSSQSSFCSCLSGESARSIMTCCRHTEADGRTAHVHIENSAPCLMYLLSNVKDGLKPGSAYTIQDIAHSETLPIKICCVFHHSSPRDEIPSPTIFRLLKIVSRRAVIAYRLDSSYTPKPENAVEILSQSSEKYALADSRFVNMDHICSYKIQMSMKIALAGQTMDEDEFKDIMKRSSGLPPILPVRSAAARRPSQISLNLSPFCPASPGSPSQQLMIVESIELPEKHRPTIKESILKRFHTAKVERLGGKRRPSLTEAISRLNIADQDKNKKRQQQRQLGKAKSLRGMEISRPIIDNIFPPTAKDYDKSMVRNSSGIYSCVETPSEENKTMESELRAYLESKRQQTEQEPQTNTRSLDRTDSTGISSAVDGTVTFSLPQRAANATVGSKQRIPEEVYMYPVTREKRLSANNFNSGYGNDYF